MRISFEKIEDAMISANDECSFWLDKQNGNVIFYGDEDVFGEMDYDETEAEAIRDIKIICGEIEADENIEVDENRYLEIIPPNSDERWKWMEEFALGKQDNPKLFNKLADALRGNKPFRFFKNALLDFPQERENWFAFENKKLREYIEDWADENNLELGFEK